MPNLLTAAGLMLFQLAVFLLVTGGKIRQFVYWDAAWYRDIAVKGYWATFDAQGNVVGQAPFGFFPAYPTWAHVVMSVLHLDANLAMAVASQIACVGFWTHFLLLLKRLGARPAVILATCFFFLIQPGAWYTLVGYSEGLFISTTLGFLYWTTRCLEDEAEPAGRRALHALLAIAFGGVMATTRFLGVVLVTYPLLLVAAHALRSRKLEPRRAGLAAVLGVASLWGLATYLYYCQTRWGRWDMYWEANRAGWNMYPRPGWILQWSYYRDVFFVGNLAEVLGRIVTLVTLAGTVSLTLWAWRTLSRAPMRLALATLALGLLLETMVGSNGMHSMLRYLIPVHALVIPLGAAWAEERLGRADATKPWPSLRQWGWAAGLSMLLLAIQILLAIRFSRNEWVS